MRRRSRAHESHAQEEPCAREKASSGAKMKTESMDARERRGREKGEG